MAYLEIPLLLRATIPVSDQVRPYAALGPALAILLDADVTYDDGRYFEINDNVETFDLGLMAGLGTTVDLGRDAGAIAVDVRYNHGLLNWSVALSDESEGVYNRAFYVTVGYRADLATLGRLFEPAPPAAGESTPVPSSPAPGDSGS